MTFIEIGRELGISEKTAYAIYARAMRKLRDRPESLSKLIATATQLREARDSRNESRNK